MRLKTKILAYAGLLTFLALPIMAGTNTYLRIRVDTVDDTTNAVAATEVSWTLSVSNDTQRTHGAVDATTEGTNANERIMAKFKERLPELVGDYEDTVTDVTKKQEARTEKATRTPINTD